MGAVIGVKFKYVEESACEGKHTENEICSEIDRK